MLNYMYTEKGNVFLNIVTPFIRDHFGSVDCTLGFKTTVKEISYEKGERCLIFFSFTLDVMPNSVVSSQILPKIYRQRLNNVLIIKFSSIMTKTSVNCFYIVNLYFPCHLVNAFWMAVLSYHPSSFQNFNFCTDVSHEHVDADAEGVTLKKLFCAKVKSRK